MAVPFEIPEWLVDQSAPPPPPPVDDHRVEDLVNGAAQQTVRQRRIILSL